MEMKINYIKFSFSSSYPSLNFIESNFIKKDQSLLEVYIMKIRIINLY